jgi:ABC-type spermidine/putrescine transport system permease subunit I
MPLDAVTSPLPAARAERGTSSFGRVALLLPAMVILLLLLAFPMLDVVIESFRQFKAGQVGAAADAPWTLENYGQLVHSAYLGYFLTTFRVSLIATVVGIMIAFPIALHIARMPKGLWRRLILACLIVLLFVSVLVRVYSLALTFGPAGFMRNAMFALGIAPNSAVVTEFVVILGLMHYVIPISAMVLIGTIQNINPRLHEAALMLGANRVLGHLTITVPMSRAGLLSAFLICSTFCISSFVIPLVLGKGKVVFVSNLIYSRFGEMSDYPSGAALSVVLVLVTLLVTYAASRTTLATEPGRR